jgi:outer membrane protein, adhesin transport system
VVPPASAQSDSAAVPAASRQAGASTVADSSTVAASVFSQWLDDKPDDEVTRGGLSAMTEAQLRQRFHDAIMVAVKRSPNVQQALAQWEATRYDVANARGRRLPQVQLSGQSATKTFGGPSQTGNPNVDAAVSVNVTTPVFDWGGARKVEQSNRQLAAAAEQGYHATLEGTALDVSNTLLELGRYRRMTAVGDAYVKRMRALVNMLAQITAADQGRRSEWLQAKAQLLQAITNRDASAAQVRQLDIKLNILLGDNYRLNLPDDGIWPIKPADTDALLAQFQDHPAIRQAQATAEAADLNAGAQRASKRPRLDWVVSKTAFLNAPGMQQAWGTSLQVSWPLFSGGSDSAAYRAALARADASRDQVDVLKRNYEYQVRNAAQAAVDAFARADEYNDLSNETLKVRKAMFEQWYQLGKRSLLDVLVSETNHYNDRIGEVSNRFDAYEAVFSAYDGAGKLADWLGARR